MSALKAFTSSFHAIGAEYNGAKQYLKQMFATVQMLGSGKVGLHTAPRWMKTVSTGNTLAASSTKRVLNITGHSLRVGDIIRFTSGDNSDEEVQVIDNSDANSVLIGQELPNTPSTDSFSILRSLTPTLASSGALQTTAAQVSVVDTLDAGSLVPTGGSLIPRSSNNALEVVNSLAADVTKIQVISDIGQFMNLYSDAARTQLICHLPLTPDESVDVSISSGTTLYVGAAKDSDINDANSILQINFIG